MSKRNVSDTIEEARQLSKLSEHLLRHLEPETEYSESSARWAKVATNSPKGIVPSSLHQNSECICIIIGRGW